ncbi:MAG: esterase-like activity of phytase family protein [Bdellovibrionaceae bacterium]|nr:esterase-like activity of phytase family protein [Pseudobdellovibrionaceae bacterium]
MVKFFQEPKFVITGICVVALLSGAAASAVVELPKDQRTPSEQTRSFPPGIYFNQLSGSAAGANSSNAQVPPRVEFSVGTHHGASGSGDPQNDDRKKQLEIQREEEKKTTESCNDFFSRKMGWEASASESQCKNWNVRPLFSPKAPKQEIDNLEVCLVNLVGIKALKRTPIDMCSDKNSRSKIAGPSFLSCHQNLESLGYSVGDILNKCTLSQSPILSQISFPVCHRTQVKYKVPESSAFERCLNKRLLDRQADQKYGRCLELVDKQFGANAGQLPVVICESEAMSNLVDDSDLKSCLDSNRIRTRTDARMLCFIPNFLKNINEVQFATCMDHSMQSYYKTSLWNAYLDFIDAIKISGSIFDTNRTQVGRMIEDCRKSPDGKQNAQENPYLRLIKEINIHTNFTPDQDSKVGRKIGGISALAYDSSDSSLSALSDSGSGGRNGSSIHIGTYKFLIDQKLNLSKETTETYEVNGYSAERVDPEGMVVMPTGQVIMSIESGLQKTGGSFGKGYSKDESVTWSEKTEVMGRKGEKVSRQTKTINESFIVIFDKRKNSEAVINLPRDFSDAYDITQFHRPKPPRPSCGESSDMFGLGGNKARDSKKLGEGSEPCNNSSDNSNTSTPTDGQQDIIKPAVKVWNNSTGFGPSRQESYDSAPRREESQISGMISNKGFEGLSLSPSGQTLMVVNEFSLFQDYDEDDCNKNPRTASCDTPVRIVTLKATTGVNGGFSQAEQYHYRMEPGVGNGVSEILAIDDNSLLVLERAFDPNQQKVTSRLFKVTLEPESRIVSGTSLKRTLIPPLKKKLILDLDGLTSQLSAGFRSIDNFEALAFGPLSPNGRRTLIMATDNNFNPGQRTSLLFFEILSDKF